MPMAPIRVRLLNMSFLLAVVVGSGLDVDWLRRLLGFVSLSGLLSPCSCGDVGVSGSAAQDVGIDGENDDDAGHDGLPFLGDREDAQAIGQHADDSAPMIVPRMVPRPPLKRGAADDDRRDGVELVALPERRLGRVEARGDEEAGNAADPARDACRRRSSRGRC